MHSLIAFAAASCLALAGCGLRASERAAVVAFGQATASFGSSYGEIVPEVRRSIRELYQESLSLPTPESEAAFRRADQRSFNAVLNQAVPPERESLTIGLARSLADYGVALGELASYGDSAARRAALNAAASGFVTLLNGAEAKQQASLVGAAVGFVGDQLFEAVRRAAIREIVIEAAPAVERSAALLRSSFALSGNAASLMVAYRRALRELNTRMPASQGTYQLSREAAFDAAVRGPRTDWGRLEGATERRRMLVRALALEADNEERLERIRTTGEAASNALEGASRKLAQVMREGGELSMADITAFISATSDLGAAVQALRSGR